MANELLSEWKIFRRALLVEKKAIMECKEESVSPSMQEVLDEMNKSHTYGRIFPETWKLLNIIMALPVGTATVERSFSQMKLIKTRLRSRLSDLNLEHLIKISIEGPPLTMWTLMQSLTFLNRKRDAFYFNLVLLNSLYCNLHHT